MNNNGLIIAEDNSGKGTVTYADDVIATIAGVAAIEVDGVAGMSGGISSGIVEMLGRKDLTKGVKVEVGKEEACIDLNIVVTYGAYIQKVAGDVQENVKKAVETMTGLHVVEINVNVQGINVVPENDGVTK